MNLAGHLNVRWLGRTEFAHALALQEELAAKKREDASLEDQMLLLEHEPVYTITCAGSSNCSSTFSPDTTLPRSDANRLPEFGSKIARSLQSASVCGIGSPCTGSR